MSKKTIAKKIAEKLATLRVYEEIEKSKLVMEIYAVDDYFIRRTFDVHLCKAKKEVAKIFPERRFISYKNGKITRLANIL